MVIEKLNIKLLVVEKDKEPYEVSVRNRLEHFRKLVGGENLEVVLLDKDSLLIFDGEAQEKNLPVNRIIDNLYKIRGTFIITGNNELEQDFNDLSEEQIKNYKAEFQISKEIKQNLEMGDDMEFWKKKKLYHL